MKRISLFTLSVLLLLVSYSQEKTFLLKRPNINSVYSIEKANKGKEFKASFTMTVAKDYFPNAGKFTLANPLIFFRENSRFTTEMNYYFSIPDSIIRLVEYSWEGNPELSSQLNSLFQNNSSYFSKYFSQAGKVKNETHDTWSQRSITWEDSVVYVNQFLVSGQTTNRVRVLISWK